MVDNLISKIECDSANQSNGENGKFIYCKKGAVTFPKIVESSIQNILILDVSCNQLKDIPSVIGTFSAVEELNCSRNAINKLSHALVQLTNLAVLDLSFNHLSCIPACISHISSLCQLWLSHNRLTVLPEEIGKNLTRLQLLDISANQLTYLPKSLSQLPNLRVLSASCNVLQELPGEFGQLKLHKLDVRNNQLTKLPSELHHLSGRLREFLISGNPLIYPPIHLCHMGHAHLLHYLRTVSFDAAATAPSAMSRSDEDMRSARGRRSVMSNRMRPSHLTISPICVSQVNGQYRSKHRRALREIKDKHINSRVPQSPRDNNIPPDYRLASKSSPPDIPPLLGISSITNTTNHRHHTISTGVDSGYNTAVRTEDASVSTVQNKARPTANSMLTSVDLKRWNSPLLWSPSVHNATSTPENRFNQFPSSSTASVKSNEVDHLGWIPVESVSASQGISSPVISPTLQDSPLSPSCAASEVNVLHALFPLLSNTPTSGNERRRLTNDSCRPQSNFPISKHHSLSVINSGPSETSLRHFQSAVAAPGDSTVQQETRFSPPINSTNIGSQPLEHSFMHVMNSSSSRAPLIGSSEYPLNRMHEYHRESSRETATSSPIQQPLSPPLISSTLVQSLNKSGLGRGDPMENKKWNDIVRKAREKKTKEIRKLETRESVTLGVTTFASSSFHYRESEPLYQLRTILEGHLNLILPGDLAAALQDGRILCQFANQIAPKSAGTTVVHQPQEGQAMLALAKCRRNLENFTAACRKVGVPEEDLFSIQSVLDGTTSSLVQVSRCVQAFIQQAPWHLTINSDSTNLSSTTTKTLIVTTQKNGELHCGDRPSGSYLTSNMTNSSKKDERLGSTTPDLRRQLFIESDV